MEKVPVHNVPEVTQDNIMSPVYTMAQAPIHNAFKDTHAAQQCSLQLQIDNFGQGKTGTVIEDTLNKTPAKCTCQAHAGCNCQASAVAPDYSGTPSAKVDGNSYIIVPSMTSKLASESLKPTAETCDAERDRKYGTFSLLYFSFAHTHVAPSTFVLIGFVALSIVIWALQHEVQVGYECFLFCALLLILRALLYSRMYLNRKENKNENTKENTQENMEKIKENTEKTEENTEETVKKVVTPGHDSSLELIQFFLSTPYKDTCPCYDCNFGLTSFYTIPGIVFLVVGFPFRSNWKGDGLFICGCIMTGVGLYFGFRRLVISGTFKRCKKL